MSISVSVSGNTVSANVTAGVGPQGPVGPEGPPGPASVASVNAQTGTVTLTSLSVSAASAVHTHVVADITDLVYPVSSVNGSTGTVVLTHTSVSAAAASHTHDASDVASGTLSLDRIPTHTHTIAEVGGLQSELDGKASLGATNVDRVESLNGVTGTLSIAAGANVTVSTAGSTITIAAGGGGDSLPAQAGSGSRLLGTDGTSASWVTRYSVVDSVVVAGDGITFSKDTAVGSITLAVAGGTTGLTVGSATPQDLGVAAAGTSGNAAREDHVHRLPTIADITAAAAVHTHEVSDITAFATEAAKHGPVSSVNSLTGTVTLTSLSVSAASAVHTHVAADITDLAYPVASVNGSTGTVVLTHTSVSAAAASHSHAASDITSGTLDIARIPTIDYTALSGVPTTFAPATHTHDIAAVDGLQSALDGKAALAATNVSRVETLNGLTGTLTITAGSNVTVSTSGSSITITAASGGGGGGGETVSRSIIWLLR